MADLVHPIPKKTRRKKTDARKLKDKADDLCRELVRTRGRCQRCESTQNLQWAHIVRRNKAATRTDESNAWLLCAKCHWLTEKEADEFMALVERTIGLQHYFALKRRSVEGVKATAAFWQSECDRLQERLDRVRGAA